MFNALQRIYCIVLNQAFKITGFLSENSRQNINKVCIFFMVFFSFYGEAEDLMKKPAVTNLCVIQAVLLCVIILMNLRKPIQPIQWNVRYPVCWFGFCGVVILTAFLHELGTGFRPLALVMLIIYPVLFFVWNNRGDYHALYDAVSKSVVIISIAFFIFCVLKEPLESEWIRYAGLTHNAGSLGKIGIVALTCGLYLLLRTQKSQWLYGMFCGMAIELILASGNRSALVTMCVQLVVVFVLYIKDHLLPDGKNKTTTVKYVIVICIIMAVSVTVSNFLLINGKDILYSKYDMDAYVQTYVVAEAEEVIGSEPSETTNVDMEPSKAASSTAPLAETTTPADTIETTSLLEQRLSVEGKSLNVYLSGRVDIYKTIFDKISLFGNDGSKRIVENEIMKERWAHNTVLEYLHRCGVFAGILFLVIELMTAVYVIRKLFAKKVCEPYQYFMVVAIIGFGLISQTDVIFNPAAGPSMLFYFLALAPLFTKNELQ